MARAILLSIGQLADRTILWVLLKSLLLTFVLLLGIGALLVAVAGWFGETWWQGSGTLAAVAGAAIAILASVLLFRAVAMAVVGFFADDIVLAVERRHYPAVASTRRNLPFGEELAMATRSAARALFANALAFPFYLILLATGVGAPILFVAVNALLLARDLGEMVGARHLPPPALKQWLAASRRSRTATGLVVAILFVVPGLNLIAPVLGAAIATHRFHGARRA